MAHSEAFAVRSRTLRLIASGAFALLAVAFVAANIIDLRRAFASTNTITSSGPDTLGRGLQDVYHVVLSDPAPASGLQITLATSNAVDCVVAPSEFSVGQTPLTITVPANHRRRTFVVQTLPGGSGNNCTITITQTSPAGWSGDPLNVAVVPAALRVRGLARTIGNRARDDGFYVETGVPGSGRHLRFVQGVSRGTDAVPVKLCSAQPAIGTIVDKAGVDNPATQGDPVGQGCEDNVITPPYARTVPNDLQFDPDPNGTNQTGDVTVTATATGFSTDTRTVTVRASAVTIRGVDDLGEGLQDGYTVALSDAATAAQTVTVCSYAAADLNTPSTAVCAVAATENSLGKSCVDRQVPQGRYRAEFVVQGVLSGECVVRATAGGYGSDDKPISVVQPALRIRQLPGAIGQFERNAPIFVDLGVPGEHRVLRSVQQWRKGLETEAARAPLTVTVSSDAKMFGTIVDKTGTDNGDDGAETANVQPAASRTVPGDLQFDPKQGRDEPVLVTATATGFIKAEREISVQAATLQITGQHDEIGARLQEDFTVHLRSAAGHAATQVTIESTTTAVCLVSATANTVPTIDSNTQKNEIVRLVGTNEDSADFVVHALDNAAGGTCTITARADLFASDEKNIDVVAPGIQIRELRRNVPLASSGEGFFVEVGVPNSQATALKFTQRVRKGTTDVPTKVCSEKPTVGVIKKLGVDHAPALDDPLGQSCEDDSIRQAFSRNVPNDLEFVPTGLGSSLVTVTAPDFLTMDKAGRIEVTVTGPAIRLVAPPQLGSNLQAGGEVHLTQVAGTGGVQVTITSSDTDRCRLAPNASTAGSTSPLVVTVSDGNDTAEFVVAAQGGLDGVTCTLTATAASGYSSDEWTIEIVQPGLQIVDLDPTLSTTTPPSSLTVQIGVPGGHDHRLRAVQALRLDDTQVLQVKVTVCTEDKNVVRITDGTLEPADPGYPNRECYSKFINEGESQVVFALEVRGVGRTVLTAGAPGFVVTDRAERPVRVSQASVNLNPPAHLGWNLEDVAHVVMSNDDGNTITVVAATPDVCRVSTSASILGADVPNNNVVLSIAAGKRSASFFVQALTQVTEIGTCTLNVSGIGIEAFSQDVELRPSRLRIHGLPSKIGSQANNEPFFVEIGPENPNNPDAVVTNRQNRDSIASAQALRPGAGARTVQVCSSVATVGKIRDPEVPHTTAACADSTIEEADSQTPDFQFDPGDDGTTVVDASVPTDPLIETTQETVRVSAVSLSIRGSNAVGVKLQDTFHVRLGKNAQPNGVQVTVQASPSRLCTVAYLNGSQDPLIPPDITQVVFTIAEGERKGDFLVRGVAASLDDDDTCHLTATATGFNSDDDYITVNTPTFKIVGLDDTVSTLDDPDRFEVRTGLLDGKKFDRQGVQLATTVKACVDEPGIGIITGGAPVTGEPSCQSAVIAAGADATKAFSLKALAASPPDVCVTISADGFDSVQKCVEVNAAKTRIRNGSSDLGAGLQDEFTLVLSQEATADLDVNVCVAPQGLGQVCEVARTRGENGANCVTVTVHQDKRERNFWVQGIEATTGDCALTATPVGNTQYAIGTRTIEVVNPAFQIDDLRSRHAATDSPDHFKVEIGVPDDHNRRLSAVQELRFNTRPGAVATVMPVACSSDTYVGPVTGGAADATDPTHCRKGTIYQERSETSEFAFDPEHDGDTFVYVREVNGYDPTDAATVHVRVGSNFLILTVPDVGAGLQDDATIALSRVAGINGVAVTITSDTPANCVVAADAFTTGAGSVAVTVLEGDRSASFVVAGLEGRANTDCRLRATTPNFIGDQSDSQVVDFGVQIVGLDSTKSTTEPPDPFDVQLGIPADRVSHVQAVRSGAPATVPVQACSSKTQYGTIGGAACQAANIAAEHAAATFQFVVVAAGCTQVTATGGTGSDSQRVCIRQTAVKLIGPQPIHGVDFIGRELERKYQVQTNVLSGLNVTIAIDSDPAGACLVSTAANVVGSSVPQVVAIPAGKNSVDIYVQGVAYGQCVLSAYGNNFSTVERQIVVVQPRLKLRHLPAKISVQARNRPFFVEIGPANPNLVPRDFNHDNRHGIVEPQLVYPGVASPGKLVQVCSSKPAVGKIVDPESAATGACADSYIPVTEGATPDFQFDPVDEDANDDNTTDVTATSTDVIETKMTVRVSLTALAINVADVLGATLQDTYNVELGRPAPTGNTQVTLVAKPDYVCTLVGGTSVPDGTQLVVTVLDGKRRGDFALKGVTADPDHLCHLSATASGSEPAEADVQIVPPALRIVRLDREVSTFDDPDPFVVQTGARHPDNPNRFEQQFVTAATDVKACVDDTTKGEVLGGVAVVGEPNCRKDSVAILTNETRAFALKPKAEPQVCVTVSATGFDGQQVCVDINASNIRLHAPDLIGAGLEDDASLTLGRKAPANLLIRVKVADASVGRCEVSAQENQNGANYIDLPVDQDRRNAKFWIQGVEGQMGECALEAFEIGTSYFHTGHRSIDVATGAFQISDLKGRHGSLDPDDQFVVEIGVTNDNLRHLVTVQELRYNTRAGNRPYLTPYVCAKATTTIPPVPGVVVGGLVDGGDADCRIGMINQLDSGTSQFSFDSLAAGEVDVYIRQINDLIPTDAASKHVIVSDTNLAIVGPDWLGNGLQDDYHIRLGKKATSDVDVTLTVNAASTTMCRVAQDPFSANQTVIHVYILKGEQRGTFELRGLAEGACALQAVATGYKTDDETIDIRPPALAITDLPPTQTVGNADNRFTVEIGVANEARRNLRFQQQLSYGGSGQRIEACSSIATVGSVVGGDPHPDPLKTNCRSTVIAAGEDETDVFLFHPNTQGDTVVTVACIDANGVMTDNCDTVDAGSRNVHVVQAGITISGAALLGAGLQDNYAAVLGTPAPSAGVSVTISSATPNRCKVAHTFLEDGVTALAPILVTKGHSRAEFVVQGVQYEMGECRIVATAPLYVQGERSIDIQLPALAIHGLKQRHGAQDADDDIRVKVGVPMHNRTCVRRLCQPVAINGGLTVDACSSDPGFGAIKGGTVLDSKCDRTTIAKGQCETNAFAFDSLTAGDTTVYVTSPMISENVDCDTIPVHIVNAALSLNGPDAVGIDLQDNFRAVFSTAPPAGSHVFVNFSGACTVAQYEAGPPIGPLPTPQLLTLTVPSSRARVEFWVQGLAPGGACEISITTDASGFNSDTEIIDIPTPGVRIRGLDTTRSTAARDEPFNVDIGVAEDDETNLDTVQEVRPHSTAYPLTLVGSKRGVPLKVCSSDTAVGTIVGGTTSGNCSRGLVEQLHSNTATFAFHSGTTADVTTVYVAEDGEALILTDASSRDVQVAADTVNITGPSALGAGLQDGYRAVLTKAAAAAGSVTLRSLTLATCIVSASEVTEGGEYATVPIGAGHTGADFFIQALEGVEGPCDVTATASAALGSFVVGERIIDVQTPAIRIINLDTSLSSTAADDPFNVEIGLARESHSTLAVAQAARARTTGGGVPVTVCTEDDKVGDIVVGGVDYKCISVTIAAKKSRTDDGVLKFNPIGNGVGGKATTTVTATAIGFDPTDAASKDVVVSNNVTRIGGVDTLGSSLEDQFTLSIAKALTGATLFTVTSSTPNLCTVSGSETVAGIDHVDLTIPSGRTRAYFFVHAQDDQTGTCKLSTSTAAVGVTPAQVEIRIVTPGLRIQDLAGSITTTAANDSFIVQTGVPSNSLRTLSDVQERRAGAANLTVTACSTDPTKAKITTAGGTAPCGTALIGANKDQTATNDLALHPEAGGGPTTVRAEATGFISTDAASKDVMVSQQVINITSSNNVTAIGAGLQDTFTVKLSTRAATGGLGVTVTSLTPTICLVAKDVSTAGVATTPYSYGLTVAGGHYSVNFAIQALEGVSGVCRVSASQTTGTGYSPDEFSVNVGAGGFRIRSLDPTTTSNAANDSFFVDVGVPKDSLSDVRWVQSVRAGAPQALSVEVCSSNSAAGLIASTSGSPAQCKTVTIAQGSSATATNVVQFDAQGNGTAELSTTVDAHATGFITTDAGSIDVVVAGVSLSFDDTGLDRVGAGLMDTFKVVSSKDAIGDQTVTVTSLTTNVCLVAPDEATTPAPTAPVVIKSGNRSRTFEIIGLENVQGACRLTAVASGMSDGFGEYDIVPAALRIRNLSTSKTIGAADDAFNVDVGVAKADLSSLQGTQKVRTASTGTVITVCSSSPTLGSVVNGGPAAPGCATTTIYAGAYTDATLKFRTGTGSATTTVDASAPNDITTDAGSVDVSVSGTVSLAIKSTSTAVGAGLQDGTFYVQAGATATGTISLSVTSLTPGLCVVASNGTTVGSASPASVTLNAGTSISNYFWVQAIEGVVGSCQLSVTASGYAPGSGVADIVKPALRVVNLASSMVYTAANDPFNVQVGVATSDKSDLLFVQQVRWGNVAGFDFTVSNTAVSVADLLSTIPPSPGDVVTGRILQGESQTAEGQLQFHPGAAGGTTVTASNPNFTTTAAGTVNVSLTSGGGGGGC